MLDRIFSSAWIRQPRARRLIFGAVILVLAIISIFPQRRLILVKLAPPESSLNLASVLGPLGGNLQQLIPSQTPAEVDLAIGRSYNVSIGVLNRLDLIGKRSGYLTTEQAVARLNRKVEVRVLRGGIIQIQTRTTDEEFGLKLVDAYARELVSRLSNLSREQVLNKRRILEGRMADARKRLSTAEQAMTRFRQTQELPAPDAQVAQSVSVLTGLEGQIQSKKAQLQVELQYATPDNYVIQRLQGEIGVLERQLSDTRTKRTSLGLPSARSIVEVQTIYNNLLRDLTFAQALYQSYVKFLEGSTIEELSSQYNLQAIEPTHVDPHWQINFIPFGLLLLTILAAVGAEIYVAAPPVGYKADSRE